MEVEVQEVQEVPDAEDLVGMEVGALVEEEGRPTSEATAALELIPAAEEGFLAEACSPGKAAGLVEPQDLRLEVAEAAAVVEEVLRLV